MRSHWFILVSGGGFYWLKRKYGRTNIIKGNKRKWWRSKGHGVAIFIESQCKLDSDPSSNTMATKISSLELTIIAFTNQSTHQPSTMLSALKVCEHELALGGFLFADLLWRWSQCFFQIEGNVLLACVRTHWVSAPIHWQGCWRDCWVATFQLVQALETQCVRIGSVLAARTKKKTSDLNASTQQPMKCFTTCVTAHIFNQTTKRITFQQSAQKAQPKFSQPIVSLPHPTLALNTPSHSRVISSGDRWCTLGWAYIR